MRANAYGRGWCLQLCCAALAIVLVAASVTAGRSFFFCAPMDELMAVPCCTHDLADSDDHSPSARLVSTDRGDCCERISLEQASSGTLSRAFPALARSTPLQATPMLATRAERALAFVRVEAPPRPPDRYTLCVLLI
jgi:hypothetical protein